MMAAVVIGSSVFTSCSNDDDNDSAGGGMTSKHISKITKSDGDGIDVTTFDYDTQGRVVKLNTTGMEFGHEWSTTTTYTYGENTIVSKVQGDLNDGITHTYTLSDGRIVKDVERYYDQTYPCTYTYDGNGYIISSTDIVNHATTEFTWTGGNLTKITKKVADEAWESTITISYSDIPWPKNWVYGWDDVDLNGVLELCGAWGKMPKNLPTKYIESSDDGGEKYTLDYTIENGEITEIIWKDLNNPDAATREGAQSNTRIYAIEWK